MKKLAILIIGLTLLAGVAMADHGIPPVPETQGIVTSTTIDSVGNFASSSEIQWRITDSEGGLPGVPPLAFIDESIYESVYTEDTVSNGVGLIFYDKELDIETSGQISGEWNIDALKELAFVGIDGARVTSSDTIFIDGASIQYVTEEVMICPFASAATSGFPSYCNRAEAGSTIDMTVANVRTTSTDRFVMPSGDHPVELNHDILVTELIDDLPSQGMASASMEVLIQEGRGNIVVIEGEVNPQQNGILIIVIGPDPLMERIEFSEETTVSGDITTFEKLMHYESMLTGGSDPAPLPIK
ncbi:MAG: hypothetical protein MUE45_01290 [Methanoregulaceae archaeon]|nr:hypothetical protein [Methanoregulaceae archaeon]MCU0628111.1 hypothetical protein [Methanoregulaceae archaeon]